MWTVKILKSVRVYSAAGWTWTKQIADFTYRSDHVEEAWWYRGQGEDKSRGIANSIVPKQEKSHSKTSSYTSYVLTRTRLNTGTLCCRLRRLLPISHECLRNDHEVGTPRGQRRRHHGTPGRKPEGVGYESARGHEGACPRRHQQGEHGEDCRQGERGLPL